MFHLRICSCVDCSRWGVWREPSTALPQGSQHTANKWRRGRFQLHKSMQKVHGWVTILRCVIHAWWCLRDLNTCVHAGVWICSSNTFLYMEVWILVFRCVRRHACCTWILACRSCVQTGFLKMPLHGFHWKILDWADPLGKWEFTCCIVCLFISPALRKINPF